MLAITRASQQLFIKALAEAIEKLALCDLFSGLALIHHPPGHRVEFKYKKRANRTDRPSGKKELGFFAQTLGDAPTRIVVKFATRYHSDAHRLLAKENPAPELLYDGTMDSTDQPGPEYSMIVMKYVEGGDLEQNHNFSLPLRVAEDVEKASYYMPRI
ncbi:hypothetical protein RSAG8_10785, partial [Rhizoctonia solani AG-8 WAC10335]